MKIFFEDTRESFYFDKHFYENLKALVRTSIKKTRDIVIIVSGRVGSGKTHFTDQLGYVFKRIFEDEFNIKREYNLDNVEFTLKDYLHIREVAEEEGLKYFISKFDEAKQDLDRKKGTSNNLVRFETYMSECRSEQGVQIFVLPNWSDLPASLITDRVNIIVDVELKRSDDGLELKQGDYSVWALPLSDETKINGYDRYGIAAIISNQWKDPTKRFRPLPNFIKAQTGKFNYFPIIDEKKYEKKKVKKKWEKQKEQEKETAKKDERYYHLLLGLKQMGLKPFKPTNKAIGDLIGVGESTIRNHIEEAKKNTIAKE